MKSILTKSQVIKKTFGDFRIDGGQGKLIVKIRYDDQCGNGHNSFAITADMYRDDKEWSGGCLHDDIAKYAPEFEPLIKWHLCNSDQPMHYIANTIYHAEQHDANKGWVYFKEPITGQKLNLEYASVKEWEDKFKNGHGYTFELDPKTEKVANLEYARSTAIWPEATLEQLQDKKQLQARLPALMKEFKQVIESLGFTY